MVLNRIKLQHFRNYTQADLTIPEGVTILCGENAQGKTNLLEAVYFLSNCKLFRSGQKKEALQFGQTELRVTAYYTTQGRGFEQELSFSAGKRLEATVNGIKQKRLTDAAGRLKSVLFSPDDLYLVREGAAARRRFLDTALCQLRPRYAQYLLEYHRLYEHKTRILRDSEEKPSLLLTLDDFSRRMAVIGAHLIWYRAFYIEKLIKKASEIHSSIAGEHEKLTAQYHTVSTVQNPFAAVSETAELLWEHALSHRAAEISSKSCLSGPHKDDLLLYIGGKEAKNYASQGQTRTCALALKLAEREMFFSDSGEYPVLLLDDVLSELDKKRQDFVLNHIKGGQVFITCCEEEKMQDILNGSVFLIKNGTAQLKT